MKILKKVRKERGLTQSQLGCQVGLTQGFVSNVERGKQPISINNIIELARVLGTDPAILLEEA